jgi:hypothetical protein
MFWGRGPQLGWAVRIVTILFPAGEQVNTMLTCCGWQSQMGVTDGTPAIGIRAHVQEVLHGGLLGLQGLGEGPLELRGVQQHLLHAQDVQQRVCGGAACTSWRRQRPSMSIGQHGCALHSQDAQKCACGGCMQITATSCLSVVHSMRARANMGDALDCWRAQLRACLEGASRWSSKGQRLVIVGQRWSTRQGRCLCRTHNKQGCVQQPRRPTAAAIRDK